MFGDIDFVRGFFFFFFIKHGWYTFYPFKAMFNVVERPHNTLVPVIAYVTAAIKCIPFPSFSLFSRMKLMRQIQLVMSSEKLRILCFIAYKKNNQLFYGLSMTFP